MLHGGEIYDKRIELDFSVNLNPLGCPDAVKEALAQAASEISNYPDINQREFCEAVGSPSNIVGGSGASELLMGIVNMVRPQKALLPVPSFYGYEHVLGACANCDVIHYPLVLSEEFLLTDEFAGAITGDIDMVLLGNPNNPTGRLIPENVLISIMDRCREVGATLVVDECFFRLSDGNASARYYIDKYSNLFVVDAYTKLFSIPGVRVGFVITAPENAEKLRKYLPEWNMSVFANRAGIVCAGIAGEGSFIRESLELINKEKDYLVGELRNLGMTVYPSDTNFILVHSDTDLYTRLLELGILIRDCSTFEGLDKGFYRIAIKDHAANERLVNAIKNI